MFDALISSHRRDVIEIALAVRLLEIDRRWQPLVGETQAANRGLNGARGAQGMAVVALGPADRHLVGPVAEYLLDRDGLRRVVERRRAAMRVDVADLARLQRGIAKREPY